MTTIVYLHGFNSAFSPDNEKVRALSTLGRVVGVNYNSCDTYDNIYRSLHKALSHYDRDELLLVGTSLGGFWAAEMASALSCFSVIINPCYAPGKMLEKYIGPQVNHVTKQKRTFTEEAVLSYGFRTIHTAAYHYLPLVLLDMEDEVIDSTKSLEIFQTFPIQYWKGGSHRFDHIQEALPHIEKHLNYCLLADHTNI